MFDDRVPDPIISAGPSRDRPFETTHFERVEAARAAGDAGARGRQRHPRRQAVTTAPGPAAEVPAGHDPAETRHIGAHLDVRA
jgi:hypothetical protein